MDQGILVAETIEAGRQFLSEFDKVFPLKAAFWLKESERDRWYLYVASDQINDSNFREAYSEVRRSANRSEGPYLNPLRVMIVKADDPLVQAVVDMWNRFPGTQPIEYRGALLGGRSIEGAYLYPLPVAAS